MEWCKTCYERSSKSRRWCKYKISLFWILQLKLMSLRTGFLSQLGVCWGGGDRDTCPSLPPSEQTCELSTNAAPMNPLKKASGAAVLRTTLQNWGKKFYMECYAYGISFCENKAKDYVFLFVVKASSGKLELFLSQIRVKNKKIVILKLYFNHWNKKF